MANRVFVIGGNHHNTLGVFRSLGECGLSPFAIIQCEESKPYIRLSRYLKKYWVVKSESDVLSLLESEGKKEEKAVLIVCSDNLSSLIDINFDLLSQWYYLPGSKEQGSITHLMNKEVMSQLARDTGFLVPESEALDSVNDLEINIHLPWIIKPLVSKDGKKTDIERVYSYEEWDNYRSRHNNKIQIQQLIEKDFEYQLIGLSLDGGNEIVIQGVSCVLRPSDTTNTGFLHYVPLDETYLESAKISKLFLKRIGYSGLFSAEFIRGVDGKDYFMEVNFRNDGNAICVTASGLNLPYIWYLYNIREDYQQVIEKSKIHSVYVMPEFADICLIRQRKLSLITWIKDILRTDRFMEFDRKDYRPALQLWREYLGRGIKKLF